MSTITEPTITIENVGPIENVSIPIPEGGGITVLKGRNGKGKSQALQAAETAITGKGKPSVRDGALRGEVEAFGVTIKVGRANRRSGELEVSSLDGKLSLSDLIDPMLKSPEAADAKRIKALVSIAGVEPSAELFYEIAGGRNVFEMVVSSAAVESTDLVQMADRIKRDFEKAARKREDEAEHADGRAKGAKEAAAGVDVTAESDSNALQARLEDAVIANAKLGEQVAASVKAKTLSAIARQELQGSAESYEGLGAEEAKEAEGAAEHTVEAGEDQVKSLTAQLEQAEADLATYRNRLFQAVNERKAAEHHEASLTKWREQIEAIIPEAPSDLELADATARMTEAREAVENGAIVRHAQKSLKDAEQYKEASRMARKLAMRHRETAKSVDEVLSEIVAKSGCDLRVSAGRLVTETGRGETFFHDLSPGERATIGVDIAIDALGEEAERAVFVLDQQIFEGIDPVNREELAQHARNRGVVILTAICSDDEELLAEVL